VKKNLIPKLSKTISHYMQIPAKPAYMEIERGRWVKPVLTITKFMTTAKSFLLHASGSHVG
jgi:hypothetical protein